MIRYRNALPVIALGTSLALAGGCKHGAGPDPAASGEAPAAAIPVETTLAAVQNMDVVSVVHGVVAAAQGASSRVAATTAGRIVDIPVLEGQSVRAGQVVAVIDNRIQAAQSDAALSAVQSSQAVSQQASLAAQAAAADQQSSVSLARRDLQVAQQEYTGSVQLAASELKLAQLDLDKLLAGARPEEIAHANQTVRQAEATRDRAAQELTRTQFLYSKGIVARKQLEDAVTAVKVDTAAVESANQDLALLKAGARKQDIDSARQKLQQAKAAYRQAEEVGKLHVSRAAQALKAAQAAALTVQAKGMEALALKRMEGQRKAEYQAARVAASTSVVTAPLSGVVLHRMLQPGDMADPATPILTIGDPERLNVQAQAPAETVRGLAVGMAAEITGTGLKNTLRATVLSIGTVDPLAGLAPVVVSVPRSAHLLAGQYVSVTLTLARHPHAIVVPRNSLLDYEQGASVFVVGHDNIAHRRTVVVGQETGKLAEIVSGVKPGDAVVIVGQRELDEGSTTRPANADKAKEPAP